MTKKQVVVISMRAANLAVGEMNADDKQFYTELDQDPFASCYEEYLDQLQTGDNQSLRTWLGWKVETGSREATEIMKLLIKSELAVA